MRQNRKDISYDEFKNKVKEQIPNLKEKFIKRAYYYETIDLAKFIQLTQILIKENLILDWADK